VQNRQSPGSEWVITDKEIVIRGSYWYWLKNLWLYEDYEDEIKYFIRQEAPVLAKLLKIRSSYLTLYSCWVTPFKVTDDWIAEDVENRLKMGWMTLLVEAPTPIRTQLFKHKHGFVENEVSRRYVDAPPTMYLPPMWRQRAPSIKQGSLKKAVKSMTLANIIAKTVYTLSNWGYQALLKLNVCPEQARFLLPQGMITQWYWTGSLDAIVRAINLRDDQHSQVESWEIMQKVKVLMAEQWPKTYQKVFSTSSNNTGPM
jgi:thymidylate synthase (FAD)